MDLEKLRGIAKKLFIEDSKRHVFLCVGESCCSKEQGTLAWEELKSVLKERNLSLSEGESACYRTKVGCLRVCTEGPILVVYPEGHWYAGMVAERIPEFVERQIVRGEPIREWIFATNPLTFVPKSSLT
jgi:(2Fe-2S) ferredoxin